MRTILTDQTGATDYGRVVSPVIVVRPVSGEHTEYNGRYGWSQYATTTG